MGAKDALRASSPGSEKPDVPAAAEGNGLRLPHPLLLFGETGQKRSVGLPRGCHSGGMQGGGGREACWEAPCRGSPEVLILLLPPGE